jgi:hypothetical protein
MIDRDRLTEILRFLRQAKWHELRRRQATLVKLRKQFHSEGVLRDLDYELRLVEEEMRARLEVARATGKPPR